MRCGGYSWPRPCRGRKATGRPATSPTETGADGAPYGVSTGTSSASSRNVKKPLPPITATSARMVTRPPFHLPPASGEEQGVEPAAYHEQPDQTHDHEIDDRDSRLPAEHTGGQLTAEDDTAVERARFDDPPQRTVERAHRKERAREQEQRQLD